MTTYGIPERATAGSVRRFVLHLGEMLLAMFVGMAVFGAFFSGILLAVGTTFDEALDTVPALIALVLMFNMTVPMVLWMHHRGHATARLLEMAGAMVAVGLVAVVCLWAGVLESTAICGLECALMVPAMIGVMLLRRGEYARPSHAHSGRAAA